VDIGHRDLSAIAARVAEHFTRALSWEAVGRAAVAAYRDVLSRRAM
jgi:hypothetical protein